MLEIAIVVIAADYGLERPNGIFLDLGGKFVLFPDGLENPNVFTAERLKCVDRHFEAHGMVALFREINGDFVVGYLGYTSDTPGAVENKVSRVE